MATNGKTHHEVVIIGGGSAGITVAAQLCEQLDKPDVAIIEPSDKHYYQPLWTLVGGGVFPKEESMRAEASLIPPEATWIQQAVTEMHPDENYVTTADGQKIGYDYLVVAPGLRIKWEAVKGLQESIGKDGVCSNYDYDYSEYTWESLRNFTGGNAVFTQPVKPFKCGGAPQKITYLADEHFRKSGVRNKTEIHFFSADPAIFGVAKYAKTLNQVIDRKEINTHYKHNLVELRPSSKEAVFQNLDTQAETVINYGMIHVTPPQGPLDFVKNSPLVNEAGWVEVDKHTTQHVRYPNVFSLGDASDIPTSKTGAAIRKQAPATSQNIMALMKGQAVEPYYDGYTSCPLVTGYGSLVLAEFDFEKKPQESFPFDQAEERYSMYMLKKYGLPRLYWHGMLRGRL